MPVSFQLPFDLVVTDVLVIAGTITVFWAIKTYVQYLKLVKSIDHLPGPRTFFSAATMITRFLPNIPYINSKNLPWRTMYSTFQEYGLDIFGGITFWPNPRIILQIADSLTTKEVTTHRAAFPKPVQFYKIFDFFGPSVLTTEGDEWKMHRKVVAKSFTEQNNKVVWLETIDCVSRLFTLWDEECTKKNEKEVTVNVAVELTRKLTLMVISAAAFGMRLSWKDDDLPAEGHLMSFRTTLQLISDGFLHRVALPNWILSLYPFGRKTKTAYEEMEVYMREMVSNRLNEPGHHEDLFSNLLRAREEEKDGHTTFTDSDLMGNIFILLFAGHETSANTLALALAALAVYPEMQERFRTEIMEYSINGQMPAYSDISKLSYGVAIIYETLRMIPIIPVIPKISAYDTKFTTRTSDGSSVRELHVPLGTNMVINVPALHYNPKYWPDPNEFRPERFLGEWNKSAWVPFSSGPRACIGRRFAEIEMLAAMAMFVLKYDIRVSLLPGETLEEARRRVLDAKRKNMLLHAKKTELVFSRR